MELVKKYYCISFKRARGLVDGLEYLCRAERHRFETRPTHLFLSESFTVYYMSSLLFCLLVLHTGQ